MKRFSALLGLGFLFGGILAAAIGGPKVQNKSDAQQVFEPGSGPGTGQKFLARMEGQWTVEKTIFPRNPEAKPSRTPGSCTQKMIMEGRFLQSDFTFQSGEKTTTGTGVIGFEAASGIFTSTWFDSRQTKMSIRRSKTVFDGEKIILYGVEWPEAKETRKSKTISAFGKDGKTIRHQQFSLAPDGSERLVMQMDLIRK